MPDIWRFAVLAVFAVTLLLGANAAYASDDATTLESVTNESVTVNYSVDSQVNASYPRVFLDNETITDSGGATLTEGTDYDWNTSTGNITWYNTLQTSEGEQAHIDYAFRRPTTGTRLNGGILRVFGGLVGVLLLVVGVGAMWNISGGGGGL